MIPKPFQNLLLVLMIITTLFSNPGSAAASGSTFLSADLRTDLPEIQTAGDFRVKIAAMSLPSEGFPSYTAGWLGIDLDKTDSPSGPRLTQVGIMADQMGIYWFTFSQAPIRCLQGTSAWWSDSEQRYLGCKGELNSHVSLGVFHTFELVNYGQGEWIARVFDSTDTGHDLAVITHPGETVYDVDVTFEEAYHQEEDPYLKSSFVFYRPQYNTWLPETGFADWPASQAQYKNTLYVDGASPEEICPTHYSIKAMYQASPRAWYAGNALEGGTCLSTLFRELYLPLTVK